MFRLDLYYRINVIELRIPPLRDRRNDILPLAQFFIDHYNRRFNRSIQAIPPETGQLLYEYDWPGNVRELRNLIERSVLLAQSDSISPDSLPLNLRDRPISKIHPRCFSDEDMGLRESAALLIANAMQVAHGSQTKAARLLGITRDVLRSRLKPRNGVAHGSSHRADFQQGREDRVRDDSGDPELSPQRARTGQ